MITIIVLIDIKFFRFMLGWKNYSTGLGNKPTVFFERFEKVNGQTTSRSNFHKISGQKQNFTNNFNDLKQFKLH